MKLPDLPHEPKKLDDNIAVWAEMQELNTKYNCESLGQGAPGYPPPEFLKKYLIEAIDEGHNQYCRTFGQPELVEKVAEIYGPQLGRTIDPYKEVIVSAGANGSLGSFILGLVNPGDELVLFEPCFPMYIDHLQMSGGKLKSVPLEVDGEGEWVFDPEVLRSTLSDKTRALVLNTPHNPTGKCFTRKELEKITEILKDFPNVIVIADEVYDFLTFDGLEHVPFASIGDNWNRTLTIKSGGKLFNATGWKVGWTIAPERILRLGGIINNNLSYVTNAPAQIGMARSLDHAFKGEGNYAAWNREKFQEVRDYLAKEVTEMDLPWHPLPCHSGYFMMANVEQCRDFIPSKYFETHDYDGEDEHGRRIQVNRLQMPDGRIPLDLAFSRWMGKEKGVTMMPNSFFYHKHSPFISESYARLAICKDINSVKKVCQALRKIKV